MKMVFPDINYPNKVCSNCLDNIRRLYSFKMTLDQSNAQLVEYLRLKLSICNKKDNQSASLVIDLDSDSDVSGTNESISNVEMDEDYAEAQNDSNENSNNSHDLAMPSTNLVNLIKVGSIRCAVCKVEFSGSDLKTYPDHLKMHTEKTFQCNVCKETYRTKAQILDHNKIVHDRDAVYDCSECSAYFLEKICLEQHNLHHKNRLKCGICNVRKENHQQLIAHVEDEHKNFVGYSCDLCPLKFKKTTALHFHKYDHTGDSKYKCRRCKIPLWDKIHENEHMMLHTGERPYKCEICFRSYRLRRTYSHHMRFAHKEVRQCEYCDFWSVSEDYFADHMTASHPDAKKDSPGKEGESKEIATLN